MTFFSGDISFLRRTPQLFRPPEQIEVKIKAASFLAPGAVLEGKKKIGEINLSRPGLIARPSLLCRPLSR
jgi:hypothetical protein